MSGSSHPTKRRSFAQTCLRCAVVLVGLLLLINAFALEPFHVPTGSMAPALRGYHRVCTCPRCGQEVVIGRAAGDVRGTGAARFYQKAFCPNCGLYPLPLDDTSEMPGDKVLVNTWDFLVRSPRLWEIIYFRIFGVCFIKRLLGLPGETISVQDGDVYIDDKLCRKTFAQAKAMRVLLQEQHGSNAAEHWDLSPPPAHASDQPAAGALRLDGLLTPQTATYRPFFRGAEKCIPIGDEYAYNGGAHDDREAVHDFMIDAEVEITAGQGSLALRLCDGRDWIEIVLPVEETCPAEVFGWRVGAAEQVRKLADIRAASVLTKGRRHRLEMALVDRRVSLAVNGRDWLRLDLPQAKARPGVTQPCQLRADGVRAVLHRFRLCRDVHYGQQGKNAVKGKAVRLGPDQYFVLGDNSANSSDSRFWPDQGRVNGDCLIGPVLLRQRTSVDGTSVRRLR